MIEVHGVLTTAKVPCRLDSCLQRFEKRAVGVRSVPYIESPVIIWSVLGLSHTIQCWTTAYRPKQLVSKTWMAKYSFTTNLYYKLTTVGSGHYNCPFNHAHILIDFTSQTQLKRAFEIEQLTHFSDSNANCGT